MTLRLMQSGLLLVVAACSAAPTRSQPSEGQPFTVTEVTTFNGPWAMGFLPGSGVRLTSNALVTDRGGTLWLVDVGSGKRQQVAGVPAVRVAGQGGLGDVIVQMEGLGKYRV